MGKILHTTWMMLRKGDDVVLAMKKHSFGVGKINGIGGKVEPGETVEAAAIRETEEEIGVTATKMKDVGTVLFDDLLYKGERRDIAMHCFVASEWEGEPIETDEMKPEYFTVDTIPYSEMWADDEFWLPFVLEGKKIDARFKYNDNEEIIEKSVRVLPE